ncbi:hypothetical protein ACFSDD_27860 [Salipiger marinus]|jgi:membrane protein implicated in regulation of membrane protease activity|uniref:Uncharacterized protein n=2 Tax=Rhodobacterales TaxID=204455 RepID=A0A5A9YZ39_9RHOB|nr:MULTISPECIES: hypothetical protein [Rhodobacterales]MBS4011101.1 hypothetical protein [Roseovarius sp.]KAA0910213.1 hypothetical protein FLO80_18205 [Aquicoccus porphyridii]KGM86042.1 hypothetical protein rosmuc_04151 [Roseovarius mucosus DSM 17069]KJS42364.1 MAG: hypothetical protein VR71_14910 [Roseovarius sp. BRH_c41]KQI67628.1 hypothetical protein AN189_13890 [Loktanella sp. 3ANDIMAR09]
MRDNLMGGLLGFGVATPVVIVCCGGGTALLAAAFGGLAAWMSGLGWIAVALVVALAFLVVREFRRSANGRTSISNHSPERKSAT